MSTRSIALGSVVLVTIALAWALLAFGDSPRADGAGMPEVLTAPRSAPREPDPVSVPAPATTHLVTSAPPVGEQLDDLVHDLDALQRSGRADMASLGLQRVRMFVLTVVGAGQRAEAVRAIEQRFDARGTSDASNEWTSARLLVALGGLGAGDAAFDRWSLVPEDQRADVLLGLVWDPLREDHGLAFEVADLNSLIPQAPLLPVTTGRIAPAAAQSLLEQLALELPAGPESPPLRNAAIVALGVGIDGLPGPEAVYATLIDHELPTAQSALRPVLFVLMNAGGDAAHRLLSTLERRHAWLDKAQHWPFGGQPYIDEIVRVEAVARREQTGDFAPLLATAENRVLPADERLQAAFSLLTFVKRDTTFRFRSGPYSESIGDRIAARIDDERDLAVANIMAMTMWWTGFNYEPPPELLER